MCRDAKLGLHGGFARRCAAHRTSGSVGQRQADAEDQVDDEDGQQAAARQPEQFAVFFEHVGVAVEGVAAGEDQQVAEHVDDDKGDEAESGQRHEKLAADGRAKRPDHFVHQDAFPSGAGTEIASRNADAQVL